MQNCYLSQRRTVWKELDVRKISIGEQIYPDVIIEFCLIIKNIYHLPLRQTTGFVEDLLALQGFIGYCIPNYSTLCRRAKQLPVCYSQTLKHKKGIHLIVDSTGIKVYGEGEWKVKNMVLLSIEHGLNYIYVLMHRAKKL